MNELLNLAMHPFASRAMKKGVDAQRPLCRSLASVEPDYIRDPDEHEFYLIGVGHQMAEVLSCCQQLAHIPIFLTNYSETRKMVRAGVTRHSAIVYHIENYVIRTQSLLDRMLKLVDAVFHLTNDPRNCRFDVILQNVKVQVSDLPDSIKAFRKLLGRYSRVRNEVAHEHSLKDEALRRLDLLYLVERWESISPKERDSNVRDLISENILEILMTRRREFLAFNKEIGSSIAGIFDKLAPYYSREEKSLRLRSSKPEN
jgi:hypothetical protein